MRKINLEGKRFGHLEVLKFSRSKLCGNRKRIYWICRCDCGTEWEVTAYSIASGITSRCRACSLRTTHNRSRTKEYKAWAAMLQRCENKKDAAFKYYGGRGIKVCDGWHTFENFYKDMGNRPSKEYSLDRINNEAGYSSENCRWATRSQQQNNKRGSHDYIRRSTTKS